MVPYVQAHNEHEAYMHLLLLPFQTANHYLAFIMALVNLDYANQSKNGSISCDSSISDKWPFRPEIINIHDLQNFVIMKGKKGNV